MIVGGDTSTWDIEFKRIKTRMRGSGGGSAQCQVFVYLPSA